MLRRAENVSMSYRRKLFSTYGGYIQVGIGRNQYRVTGFSPTDYDDIEDLQHDYPFLVIRLGGKTYWRFDDRFYWETESLTDEQVHALLVAEQERERGRLERAQAMLSSGANGNSETRRRKGIPDEVKQFVWLRDGGRCCHCGAQTELQFDHVIPFALGGSDSGDNLQILCGPCNRRKGANLTVR